MKPAIEWTLYRSFLSVLREGSLSAAARSLGMAQPTLGRHIAALETALGLALFTRSQTGLQATEAALSLRAHAQAMESTAAAIERTASSYGDGVRGVVRVTASEVVGVEVLPPVVAQLARDFPELKVELLLSNNMQDLLQREADIAVRMARPTQEQLLAKKVGEIALGLHATASYLERCGTPTRLDALRPDNTFRTRRVAPPAPVCPRTCRAAHRQRCRATGPDPCRCRHWHLPVGAGATRAATGARFACGLHALARHLGHDA